MPDSPSFFTSFALLFLLATRCCSCWPFTTAYANGRDCLLVEDDCVFKPDFAERYETFINDLPDDADRWDMAYLGGQLLATEFYPVMGVVENPHVLYAKNVHRNHAWLCHWAAIPRLVAWLEMENWPCAQTIDSRIGYLQMEDDFRVYIPKAGWMCGQAAGHSSLVEIPFPERWWPFTEPEFSAECRRWKRFERRQRLRRCAAVTCGLRLVAWMWSQVTSRKPQIPF